jgi:hypothetical protein
MTALYDYFPAIRHLRERPRNGLGLGMAIALGDGGRTVASDVGECERSAARRREVCQGRVSQAIGLERFDLWNRRLPLVGAVNPYQCPDMRSFRGGLLQVTARRTAREALAFGRPFLDFIAGLESLIDGRHHRQ